MARYKVTIGFVKFTLGPSESYITPDTTIGNLTGVIQELIDKRQAMLTKNVLFAGVRIGQVPDVPGVGGGQRRSSFYPPGTYNPWVAAQYLVIPSEGLYTSSQSQTAVDQTRACLETRLIYDTDRSVIRYLAFPPDLILEEEPNPPDWAADPTWTASFATFANMLVGKGWCIVARNRGAGYIDMPILNWVVSAGAPTNMGIVLPAQPPTGIAVRDLISIKNVRRKGTDQLSYNGKYYVDSINTTQVPNSVVYYLRGSEIGDPNSIKRPGVVQRIGYGYQPILKVEGLRAGVHKRGKSFATPRGSRRKRLSLDP